MSDLRSKDNCAGHYLGLWRVLYATSVPVRVHDATGDSNFSHWETRNGQFDVVALNEGLALEAYKVDHPTTVYTRLTNPERVCYVDAIVAFALKA